MYHIPNNQKLLHYNKLPLPAIVGCWIIMYLNETAPCNRAHCPVLCGKWVKRTLSQMEGGLWDEWTETQAANRRTSAAGRQSFAAPPRSASSHWDHRHWPSSPPVPHRCPQWLAEGLLGWESLAMENKDVLFYSTSLLYHWGFFSSSSSLPYPALLQINFHPVKLTWFVY